MKATPRSHGELARPLQRVVFFVLSAEALAQANRSTRSGTSVTPDGALVSNPLVFFMRGNRGQERPGEFLQFCGADADDAGEFVRVARAARGHVE